MNSKITDTLLEYNISELQALARAAGIDSPNLYYKNKIIEKIQNIFDNALTNESNQSLIHAYQNAQTEAEQIKVLQKFKDFFT